MGFLHILEYFSVFFTVISFLLFASFSIVSYSEKEIKASKKSLLLAFFIPILFIGKLSGIAAWSLISAILSAFTLIATIIILIPRRSLKSTPAKHNDYQYDERSTMFSRKEISDKPNLKEAYYNEHPQHLKADEIWRKKAGLMSERSTMYNSMAYAAADASFYVIGNLKPYVFEKPSEKRTPINEKQATEFIQNWSKKLGALEIGICKTEPYHFYSHRGRGKAYGQKVDNKHAYAIALTVEMNKELLATGPASPTLMESSQQYLNSGVIALQLAQFIRNLGYEARAHIDGDYELICPLVARDTGLGELGRMGLLMTPKLGPRVRIAVVTTELNLIPSDYKYDNSVHEFCTLCKKCADVCPSKAISHDDKSIINKNLRWQISHEKCFDFWCTSGTDCGRCMSVCPYSHPNNLMHNTIRWGIRYSKVFSYIALWMDDYFYGRKPKPLKIPDWIPNESKNKD